MKPLTDLRAFILSEPLFLAGDCCLHFLWYTKSRVHLHLKGKGTLICNDSAPSYEPMKCSGMDHTAFTLQIHHTCLYLVAFTRRQGF